MAASRASIADEVRAMLLFQRAGAEVFDNGNLIRTQAKTPAPTHSRSRSSLKPICGRVTSAGVTVIADGTARAAERLAHALTNDTSLGLIRYADGGYPESLEEIEAHAVPHIRVG